MNDCFDFVFCCDVVENGGVGNVVFVEFCFGCDGLVMVGWKVVDDDDVFICID